MRKTLTAFYLILLLLTSTPATVVVNAVDVWFLGIDSGNPFLGIAIKTRIQIRNSTFYRVSIHNADFDRSVYYSFLLAGYAIRYVCGINVDGISADVHVYDRRQITGSSASLAYTIAILKALNRTSVADVEWGASGVTSIDGFIDAVGGLNTKIRAAKEAGVKIVYVPEINGFTEDVDDDVPRIIEITSLVDLCRNHIRSSNSSAEPSHNEFVVVNEFFKHKVTELLHRIAELIDGFPITARSSARQFYENVSASVGSALERNRGYTAANYAFLGYIQLLRKYLELNSTVYSYLVRDGESTVKEALAVFSNFKYIHTSTIPLLVVVLDRITEAQFYIGLYKNLTKAPVQSVQQVLDTVTRISARSLTIDVWLDLLKLVNSTLASSSVDGRLVPFNRMYRATLEALKAVSSIVEWNQEFAPLSLSAIAASRNTLAKRLDSTSRLKVVNSLRELYRIHISHLDAAARVIPYIYYSYAEDLELDGSDDYIGMLSTSTLIAAITNIIRDSMNRNAPPIKVESSYIEITVLHGIRTTVLSLYTAALALSLTLLLHIIKKSSRVNPIIS